MKPNPIIESEEKSFLGRTLVWVETHTLAVAFIATVLIVAIVIVIISHIYSESRLRRAQQGLKDAMSAKIQGNIDEAIDGLKGGKKGFGNTPIADKYSYELANTYYEAGRLEEAKAEYEWFFKNYPRSPLNDYAMPAYEKLKKDIEWQKKEEPKMIALTKIDQDPWRGASGNTSDTMNPAMLSTTKFDIETNKGNKLSFELFDNNAPNTADNFVSLVNKNVYNGVKLYVAGGKEISPEVAMVEPTLGYKIPLEKTDKPAEKGALVMPQDHPAKFSILLKTADSAAMTYSCVFGKLTGGFDTLSKIQNGETISKITLTEKRDSYPPPQKIK